MDASIIIPAFKPDKNVLERISNALKNQKFGGRYELLIIDRGWGFSKQMNFGIRKSKYEIVIMLPQDCIPEGKYWLRNLLAPFKDKKVVASVSRVKFPDKLWKESSNFTKVLIAKEKGTITSLLDGKGSAYRKKALKQIGLFDEKNFRTAGEDFDIYIKLKKIGRIFYPNATIIHYHPTTFIKRLKKDYQYANGYGALVRIHRRDMARWYAGILRAIPFFGIPVFLYSYLMTRLYSLFPVYLTIVMFNHIFYIYGFWKGFFEGKQTV